MVKVQLRAPSSEIIEARMQSADATSAESMKREDSIFSHSASLSLGGGRRPCRALECRLKRSDELARFAALYSDKVFIHNFIADQELHSTTDSNLEDYARETFINDVAVMLSLRPLIEAGRIVPVTPPHVCDHCISRMHYGMNADKLWDAQYEDLLRRYREETDFTLVQIPTKSGVVHYALRINGDEALIEHGTVFVLLQRLPQFVQDSPRILGKLRADDAVSLSKHAILKSGLDRQWRAFADETFRDLSFELAVNSCINTSFLTERPLHISILDVLSSDAVLTIGASSDGELCDGELGSSVVIGL